MEVPLGPDTAGMLLSKEAFAALRPLSAEDVDDLRPNERITYVLGDADDPNLQRGYSATFAGRTELLNYPKFEIDGLIYRGSAPDTRDLPPGKTVIVSRSEARRGRVREPVSRYT